MLKKLLLPLVFVFLGTVINAQTEYALHSPDRRIEVKMRTVDRIYYTVLLNGKPLLQDSTLAINIDHRVLGNNPKIKSTKEAHVEQQITPTIHQKSATISENYNELRLEMEGDYAVVFRAYNEGIAYRFETTLPQGEVKIYS